MFIHLCYLIKVTFPFNEILLLLSHKTSITYTYTSAGCGLFWKVPFHEFAWSFIAKLVRSKISCPQRLKILIDFTVSGDLLLGKKKSFIPSLLGENVLGINTFSPLHETRTDTISVAEQPPSL